MKMLAIAAAVSLTFSGVAAADEIADAYKAQCKGCHGADGKGDTKIGQKEKVEDMTSPKWQASHSDAQIKNVIANGSDKNPKMKAFKTKLTPAQIDGMVALIRSMK
jgi:mono/diheme cytochrome c family protein